MKEATAMAPQISRTALRCKSLSGSRTVRRPPFRGGKQRMMFGALVVSLLSSTVISAQEPALSPSVFASVQPNVSFTSPGQFSTATEMPVPVATSPSAPASTPAPVASTSGTTPTAPSATLSPIATPPQPERFNPTAAPTGKMFNATGEVYIQLNYVGGNMSADIVQQYEEQCSKFFTRMLATLSPPVLAVDSTLVSQKLLPVVPGSGKSSSSKGNNSSTRYLRLTTLETTDQQRWLQTDLPPLLTKVRTSGRSVSQGIANGMNDILYYALLNDPEGFVRLLRQTTGTANLYFRLVETVIPFNADDPNAGQPPAPAPSPSAPAPTGGGNNDNDGLATGAIAVIVLVVCLWVGIVGFAVWYTWAPKTQDNVPEVPPNRESPNSSRPPEPKTTMAAAVAASQSNNKPEEIQTAAVAVVPNRSSMKNSGIPTKPSSDVSDNMSYAYSLDPGNVDASVGGVTAAKSGESGGRVSRVVKAPPGKLGIVIDTTLEGPIVHRVNPGSPLEGMLNPGDIIVAIDDVDTKAMSASAITALMVKTANQQRMLTILSGDGSFLEGGGGAQPEPIQTAAVVAVPSNNNSVLKSSVVKKEEPQMAAASVPAPKAPEKRQQQRMDEEPEISVGVSGIESSDYGGDNMSYAYSLDPGNVDNPNENSGVPNTATGESTQDDTNDLSARASMISRKVNAPPGKLGIVIDTTLEGPIVHRVNPGSALEGLVYPGDVIVAIDDVDTRAMSASSITALMVKTSNQQRVLTVLSEESGEGDSSQG